MPGASKGRRVAVVGTGYSLIGRSLGLSLEELTRQSVMAALEDAGLKASDIDGVSTHGWPGLNYVNAIQTGSMLGTADLAWISGTAEGPAFMTAAIEAVAAVASGSCETAVAIRTMLRATAAGATSSLARASDSGEGMPIAGDAQFVVPYGGGRPAQWAALYMQRCMHEFGWTEEMFGAQMVSQRHFASLNPRALLRTPITMEDYLNSRYVATPCHLLDCDYPVDGSGAVIFTTEERARDLRQKPVFVESWSFGTNQQPLHELQPDMARMSPHTAAQRMWAKTGLGPQDLDVAGLYDGFSVIALNWLEALGVVGRGEAGPFVLEGNTRLGGKLPVNCDGGAANVGRVHGVNFIAEVVSQLRGTSGPRQTPGARVGVATSATAGFSGCMLFTAD